MSSHPRARRAFIFLAAGSAAILTACANMPDGDTVCPDRGQNSGSWPYCAPSDPGGGGGIMRDDRINPAGGRS
ncbi:MAG: hypothetical protein ACK4NO_05630 [Glycocaulis sp.]